MEETNTIRRRSVLKSTGTVFATVTGTSGIVAAQGASDDGMDSCQGNFRIIAETETHVYVATGCDSNANVYKINKGTGGMEISQPGSQFSVQDMSSISPDEVASMAYDLGAKRSEGIFRKTGGCHFPYIGDHYYAGVAMETPKNPAKYKISALSGMICAAIGVSTPIPGDEILFGGFCSLAATAIQEAAFDSTFTVGGFDTHEPWPHITAGISPKYNQTDHDQLMQVDSGPGHIELLL